MTQLGEYRHSDCNSVLTAMFRFILASAFIACVNAQATSVDDLSKVSNALGNLHSKLEEIRDDVDKFLSEINSPQQWYEDNKEKIDKNKQLIAILQMHVTSTMTEYNNTQKLQASTINESQTSELHRSEALTTALVTLARRADAMDTHVAETLQRQEALRAQQGGADEALNEAQARLAGLRDDLDALIKREGGLEVRLKALADRLHAQKVKAETVAERKKKAKEEVEKVIQKTEEIEKAINQTRTEIEALKTKGLGAPNVTASPSVNYIKSVKTASGKGKRIRLVLLSD